MKRRGRLCDGWVRDADGDKRGCPNEAVPVFVVGEFGRSPKHLCESCIARAREIGWKVEFQINAGVDNAQTEKGSR